MDGYSSLDKTKRQTINPLIDEMNKQVEPLLKDAMLELDYSLPLYVRLYNQIRFYEQYGKLKSGFSVASKQTLAEQFSVTVKQIETAYSHLTNTYKLGTWVEHDDKLFRNVTRTWVSNARLKELQSYSHSMRAELSQHESNTLTACELPSDKRPLSENKIKVIESKNGTNVPLAQKPKMPSKDIDDLFMYWQEKTGMPISSRIKANRYAASNLLRKHGAAKIRQLIDGVAIAQTDAYAPRISDFSDLQSKLNALLVWGKTRSNYAPAEF